MKGISETAFSGQVEHLLRLFQWHWMHPRPARTLHGWRTAIAGYAGYFDYTAVRPPRLLFIELKDEKTKLTPEQEEWFELVRECQRTVMLEPLKVKGGTAYVRLNNGLSTICIPEVYLWRPHQIDEIAEILR